MPALNGVELQSLLQAQGHRVPFIFITAFPEEATRAQALKAGAIAFLTKPFNASTMIRCLETALNGRGGRTGN
jgi:FixJ family two-component response regulator